MLSSTASSEGKEKIGAGCSWRERDKRRWSHMGTQGIRNNSCQQLAHPHGAPKHPPSLVLVPEHPKCCSTLPDAPRQVNFTLSFQTIRLFFHNLAKALTLPVRFLLRQPRAAASQVPPRHTTQQLPQPSHSTAQTHNSPDLQWKKKK